jgi:hypothetical protein
MDLSKFDSVKELLAPYGVCVILYPEKSTDNGHWTVLFYGKDKNKKKVVEFFDPYGIAIDKEFNYIKQQYPRYLAGMLLGAGLPIHYNDYQLQRRQNGVNTCGKHVLARLFNKHLPIDEYAKEISKVDPDIYAASFYEKIKK